MISVAYSTYQGLPAHKGSRRGQKETRLHGSTRPSSAGRETLAVMPWLTSMLPAPGYLLEPVLQRRLASLGGSHLQLPIEMSGPPVGSHPAQGPGGYCRRRPISQWRPSALVL